MMMMMMPIGVEANLCSLLPGVSCKPNPVRQIVTFQVEMISKIYMKLTLCYINFPG